MILGNVIPLPIPHTPPVIPQKLYIFIDLLDARWRIIKLHCSESEAGNISCKFSSLNIISLGIYLFQNYLKEVIVVFKWHYPPPRLFWHRSLYIIWGLLWNVCSLFSYLQLSKNLWKSNLQFSFCSKYAKCIFYYELNITAMLSMNTKEVLNTSVF